MHGNAMHEWSCVWRVTTVALFIVAGDERDDQQLSIVFCQTPPALDVAINFNSLL